MVYSIKADTSQFTSAIENAQKNILSFSQQASTAQSAIQKLQQSLDRSISTQNQAAKQLLATRAEQSLAESKLLSLLESQKNALAPQIAQANQLQQKKEQIAETDKTALKEINAQIKEQNTLIKSTTADYNEQIKALKAQMAINRNAIAAQQQIRNSQNAMQQEIRANLERELAARRQLQQVELARAADEARLAAERREHALRRFQDEASLQRQFHSGNEEARAGIQRLAQAESALRLERERDLSLQIRITEARRAQIELESQVARFSQRLGSGSTGGSGLPPLPTPSTSVSPTPSPTTVNEGSTRRAREETERLTGATQNHTRAMREQTQAANVLDEGFGRLSRSFQGFAAAYLGFSAMSGQGTKIVDDAVKFERLEMVFEGILGSGDLAAAQMDFVKEAANRLGVGLFDAAQGMKGLMAVGETMQIPLSDINQTFTALTQASAAFGMAQVDTERAFRAVGQVMSKDKLTAEELVGQLSEAIPGAVGMMAKALGYLTKEGLPDTVKLFAVMKTGTIDGTDAIKKFGVVLKDTTDKMVLSTSASAVASFNRWKNAVTELRVTIGESGLLEALKSLADMGTNIISGTTTKDLADFGNHLTALGVIIGGIFIAKFIQARAATSAFAASIVEATTIARTGFTSQSTAALQAANANNTLLLSTRALTASQAALRAEMSLLHTMHGAGAVNLQRYQSAQREYNNSINETNNRVGRLSGIAGVAGTVVRALGGIMRTFLPIAIIMAGVEIWNNLESSIADTKAELDDLATSGSWAQMAENITDLSERILNMQTGGDGLFGVIKEKINAFVRVTGTDFWAGMGAYGKEGFDKVDKQILQKTIDVKRDAEIAMVKAYRGKLSDVIDAKWAGAGLLLKDIERINKKLKFEIKSISESDMGGAVYTQKKKEIDAMLQMEQILKNKEMQPKEAVKDGKSGSTKQEKDDTNELISAMKKQLELEQSIIDIRLEASNIKGDFGKDQLDYYKERAALDTEIIKNQKELQILQAKKAKPEEQKKLQAEINGLIQQGIGYKEKSVEVDLKFEAINKQAVEDIKEAEIAGWNQYESVKAINDIAKEYAKNVEKNSSEAAKEAAAQRALEQIKAHDMQQSYKRQEDQLSLAQEITELTLEGKDKEVKLEEIRHANAVINIQKEMEATAKSDYITQNRLQTKMLIENERFKQNTSSVLKYINKAFDALEKGIDDALFDVLTGKFEDFGESLMDMFEDFGTQIARELTGSLASELSGGLNTVVKDALGLGVSQDLMSVVSSSVLSPETIGNIATMTGSVMDDNGIITTEGGTVINSAAGTVSKQGKDFQVLSQTIAAKDKGILTALSSISNMQTAYSLLSGSMATKAATGTYKAMTTLGFAPETATTAAGYAGEYASGLTFSGAGSAGAAGIAGGATTGGALGYAAGRFGDSLTGSKTQASTTGAIAGAGLGATYMALGSIPVYGWIAAAALLLAGGAMGSNKETGRGVDIFKATGDSVKGESFVESEYKSWFNSSKKRSTTPFDDAQMEAISKTIKAYDSMLIQMGDLDRIVIENKSFSNLQDFVDVGIPKAFLEAIGQTDTEASYKVWQDYAKGIDKTVGQAFSESIATFTTTKQEFDKWALTFKGDEIGALRLDAEQSKQAFETLSDTLGVADVNVDNFNSTVSQMVAESFTPQTIENVKNLGDSLKRAEESQKAYREAVNQVNMTIDESIAKVKKQGLSTEQYIKNIEAVTGMTVSGIRDIVNIGEKLRTLPNITSSTLNAFTSLANGMVAMRDKVSNSVNSSIRTVFPKTTTEIQTEFKNEFGVIPSTKEEWKKIGENLINSVSDDPKTTEELVNTAYTVNLGRDPDEGGKNYWTEQLNTGALTQEQFWTEFKKATEAPDNADVFSVPDISDKKLDIYDEFGKLLVNLGNVTESTGVTVRDTTNTVQDLGEKLNYTSKFLQTWKEWLVKDDEIKTIELSKNAFEDFQKQIGQSGTTVENFMERFQTALAAGLTEDNLNLWESMGGALIDFVDGLKAMKAEWEGMTTAFTSAMDEITGANKKSFTELRAMAPTTDNYNDLISMLNDARQLEIDKITEASNKRLEALNKEKSLFLDLSSIIKSINTRIVDITPINNVYYKTELQAIKGKITRGEDVSTSDLNSSTSSYLDKFKSRSATKEDYIRESAKVREEIASVQGYGTTLSDIEKSIKQEEESLKLAIESINTTALGILDNWRAFSIENTNRIVEAINGLKMPELATYLKYEKGKLYPLKGGGSVLFYNESEFLEWSSQGKIEGSYASGIDSLPKDSIVMAHQKEAILNRVEAEKWRENKQGIAQPQINIQELVIVMIAQQKELEGMRRELKDVYELLKRVTPYGDAINTRMVS